MRKYYDLLQLVNDLNNQILQGKALEAFEKYYPDDVVMQENNQPATVAKDANRQWEKEYFGAITQFHGAEVKNLALEDNLSMVEWSMDYDHKEYGRVKSHQVAVQTWRHGQIVNKHFYYGS